MKDEYDTRELRKRFLTNTDETGRFIVKSFETGKVYYVEPIGYNKTVWGDLNPATGKIEGSYGNKYRGSVTEEESLITEENGFNNITMISGGSPFAEIERRDNEYKMKMKSKHKQ